MTDHILNIASKGRMRSGSLQRLGGRVQFVASHNLAIRSWPMGRVLGQRVGSTLSSLGAPESRRCVAHCQALGGMKRRKRSHRLRAARDLVDEAAAVADALDPKRYGRAQVRHSRGRKG